MKDKPAFPCPTGSDGGLIFPGMSLREWYAGMALPAVMQASYLVMTEATRVGVARKETLDTMLNPEEFASASIAMADAMMKQLGYDDPETNQTKGQT